MVLSFAQTLASMACEASEPRGLNLRAGFALFKIHLTPEQCKHHCTCRSVKIKSRRP